MNETITAVTGIRVGHWTSDEEATGCSVVVLPEPNVVAVEIRGGAPGSRELALLQPGMRVTQAQAILLTGGSAFGLSAADGVVRGLAAGPSADAALRVREVLILMCCASSRDCGRSQGRATVRTTDAARRVGANSRV